MSEDEAVAGAAWGVRREVERRVLTAFLAGVHADHVGIGRVAPRGDHDRGRTNDEGAAPHVGDAHARDGALFHEDFRSGRKRFDGNATVFGAAQEGLDNFHAHGRSLRVGTESRPFAPFAHRNRTRQRRAHRSEPLVGVVRHQKELFNELGVVSSAAAPNDFLVERLDGEFLSRDRLGALSDRRHVVGRKDGTSPHHGHLLEHHDLRARFGRGDRGRKAGRARTEHDHVTVIHRLARARDKRRGRAEHAEKNHPQPGKDTHRKAVVILMSPNPLSPGKHRDASNL